MTSPHTLQTALGPHGLMISGHCAHDAGGTLALVSPEEPHFWDIFAASPEARDGTPNAMDRWSTRVLTAIGKDLGIDALFPFGGPPYQPFYTWALRSGAFWASPIGFLVHARAGLFTSFRGAFVVADVWPEAPLQPRPCDTCSDQPCKTACPVGAFDDGYDVAACKTHLNNAKGRDCMELGCRARRICPVGQGQRQPAQAAFHMKAFR